MEGCGKAWKEDSESMGWPDRQRHWTKLERKITKIRTTKLQDLGAEQKVFSHVLCRLTFGRQIFASIFPINYYPSKRKYFKFLIYKVLTCPNLTFQIQDKSKKNREFNKIL